MKYYFVMFEDVRYWIEVDSNSFAMRQIVVEGEDVEISSFQDCLSEIQIIEEEMEGDVKQITSLEFDAKWETIMVKYSIVWKESKRLHPVGSKISGQVMYFYPHGTIIEIEEIKGLYLHDTTNIEIGQRISGVVSGYDEINRWVIVKNCT